MEPGPPAQEHVVLGTGSPGKSLVRTLKKQCFKSQTLKKEMAVGQLAYVICMFSEEDETGFLGQIFIHGDKLNS